MSEPTGPAEPLAAEPVEPAAAPASQPIVYVGGEPESSGPRFRGAMMAAVAAGLVLVLAVAGSGLWLLNASRNTVSFRPVAGNTAEPPATKAFVDALHRGDPVGMRAQVTKACLADQNSSLCFGPEADTRFKQSMAHRTVDLTFLRRYDGKLATIVLYDLFVRDTSTGEQVEWILTLRLSTDGRIDRAITS